MLNWLTAITRHKKFPCINIARTKRFSIDFNLEIELKKLNDKRNYEQALRLFDEYKDQQILTDKAIVQALKACTQLNRLEGGKRIHKMLSSLSLNNNYIQSTLIHFYMQCGDVANAQRVFNSSMNKTNPLYGAMMKGYLINNMPEKSIDLFSKIKNPNEIILVLFFNSCTQTGKKEMLVLGQNVLSKISLNTRQNKFICSAVLNMFIKYDDASSAEDWFSKMKCDVIDYGQIMRYFNDKRLPIKCINLYNKMKNEGIKGDLVTYLLLIDACSQIGIESICRTVVSQIPTSILKNVQIQTALVHMWGKAGCIDESKHIFDLIDNQDPVSYTAMINSYGLNGMGHKALEIFYKMPNEMIVEKTYVCVLNACSHSGLADEARTVFSSIKMKNKWVYTAMVDCLSRLFYFDEVQDLIKEFERNHEPCLPMYMSLLSGVRNKRDARLAQTLTDRMKQIFPNDNPDMSSASLLLANTLASSGDIERASLIKWHLSQSGTKKLAGMSWTYVNGKVVQFHAQDRSHPNSKEIYRELDHMKKELITNGHKFDASWITRPLLPDETVESVLNSHSERLALAFNFIQQPIPPRINITKNLRICGDCHAAIKLLSRIRKCQIFVRDANRFHHFSNGECSCCDHF